MDRQRSMGRYRLIDLGLWLVILYAFETIVIRAAVKWYPGEPYWVSVVPVVTAVVYLRWGAWGAIHAVLGGMISCLAIGAEWEWFVIYGAGNLASLAVLGLIRLLSKDAISKDALKGMLYALSVFVLMQAGKALVSLAFGWQLRQTLGLFLPEVITLLFTEVVFWICRRLDGVTEDQEQYVRRIQAEQQKERGDAQ